MTLDTRPLLTHPRLKDCDVTWLYGPLQPGPNGQSPARSGTGSSALLSKSGSSSNLAHKKPILKKRSTSEVMLQRSLSTASLLKQAAAAVQAQESTRGILRPAFVRASTDYAAYPFTTGGRRLSGGNLAVPSSFYTSTAASSLASPSVERKHIHFNEQVEQCIAVDVKGDDDDDDEGRGRAVFDDSDGDSSDDGIVMKRSRSRKKAPVLNRGGGGGGRRRHRHRTTTSSSSSSTASLREMGANSGSNTAAKTTIAMLPSTTLKYREDTPERSETAMKHSTGRSPLGSPTSSQETLRPSRSRGRFMLGDEDEDDGSDSKDEEAMAVDGFCNPDGDDAGHDDAWLRQHSGADDDGSSGSGSGIASPPSDDGKGLQRTASGMLMPYDEAEARRDGMFGRVVDTVNTARDIAHVIWNVGWRK